MYVLKDDEDSATRYFLEDETVARSIDQEDLTTYFMEIIYKVSNINLLSPMKRIISGSKLSVRVEDNMVILDFYIFFFYFVI